jgi:hypothetical protein
VGDNGGMKYPEGLPSVLKAIIEAGGYVTRSGNRAYITLVENKGPRNGVLVMWDREASEADKDEFEQLTASQSEVVRGPDLEEPDAAAKAWRDFVRNPTRK